MSAIAQVTLPRSKRHTPLTGRLREAAREYQRILAANPNHAEALAGMSLVALASRQRDAALKMAQAAVVAAPKMAAAWVVLGQALRASRRAEDAARAYETALKIDAENALAHSGLGELKIAAGEPEAAMINFARALSREPNLIAARMGLGHALGCMERFEEALARYEEALALDRRLPEAEFAAGFALAKLGRVNEAERRYRRSISLRPDFAAAWMNLGCLLREQGNELYAEASLRRALELRPDLVSAWINLSLLKREQRKMDEAEECLRRAESIEAEPQAATQIAWVQFFVAKKDFRAAWERLAKAEACEPENAEAANMRGILLHNEGRFAEAVAAFERAEARGSKQAASNRGNSLLDLGRAREALAAHARAVELDPRNPGSRYNLALTELRMGQWAEGWRNYESRWSFREVHRHPRIFNRPRWRGEELRGQRVLLHAEQGLGDTIQFCRYATLVARRGGFPVLRVQPAVERLMYSLEVVREGRAEVTRLDGVLPEFDLECPLMSLPAVFETAVETVPWNGAYLSANIQDTRAARLPDGDCRYPRIGIAWAGNPRYKADARRSTTLTVLRRLLETPGVEWVSLQKGDAAKELALLPPEIPIVDAASADRDLADAAATIAQLDLVITTDTSIAHLAGAMARPVWILLPHQADWRWMQDVERTPWYPTARLIRQAKPDDWAGVVERVVAELGTALHSYRSASIGSRLAAFHAG